MEKTRVGSAFACRRRRLTCLSPLPFSPSSPLLLSSLLSTVPPTSHERRPQSTVSTVSPSSSFLEWLFQTPNFCSSTGNPLSNPSISMLSPIRIALNSPSQLLLLHPPSLACPSSISRMSSFLFLRPYLLPIAGRYHSWSRSNLWRPLLTYFLPSLVTLAVQNATLSLLMHYSRVSMPPSRAYSAASAVLATELLKGLISLLIALIRVRPTSSQHAFVLPSSPPNRLASSPLNPNVFLERCRIVGKEVFRPDCWKLAIPAILYG